MQQARIRPSDLAAVTQKPQLTWAVALRQWSSFLSLTGFSESTVYQYRRAMIAFITATLLDPNFVTEDDVIAYVSELSAKGGGRGAILRAMRSYYGSWAVPTGLVPVDPSARIPIPREKYGPAPDISDEDLARFIYTAANLNPRWAWAFLFNFGTGGRIASLCAVRAEDVDWERQRVHFRVAKNDRPYSVELGAQTFEAARELRRYGKSTLIGVGTGRFWQWFDITSTHAEIHVSSHLLRHAFATRLAIATPDHKTWMELMNHQDLSQFGRYVASNEERHREAITRAGL